MTHDVAVYDIFLCRHTLQIYSLRSVSEVRTVKCDRQFNPVEGVLSYTLCRVTDRQQLL